MTSTQTVIRSGSSLGLATREMVTLSSLTSWTWQSQTRYTTKACVFSVSPRTCEMDRKSLVGTASATILAIIKTASSVKAIGFLDVTTHWLLHTHFVRTTIRFTLRTATLTPILICATIWVGSNETGSAKTLLIGALFVAPLQETAVSTLQLRPKTKTRIQKRTKRRKAYSFRHASILESLMPAGWWKAWLSFWLVTRRRRKPFVRTLFSRSYQCWTQTAWSTETTDVLWQDKT